MNTNRTNPMDMTTFRPADSTAAAIQTALTKAEAAQQQLLLTLADHKTSRDGLLLDGNPKELNAAEQALKGSRDTVERIDAIVEALRSRHAAAEQHEAEQKIVDASTALGLADADLANWWRKAGPTIRTILLEGHVHSKAIEDAGWEYRTSLRRLQERYEDSSFVPPIPTSDATTTSGNRARIIARWLDGETSDGEIA
jgi:hypothetical protein